MRKPLFLLLVLLMPTVVSATDLGEVRVAVADRTPPARDEAVVTGLEKVLVRLSGDVAVRSLDGASSLFSQPTRYLQRYEYQLPAPPKADQPPLDAAEDPSLEGAAGQLMLAMRFDVSSLVDRMLALGLPVWSTRRPGVLGWVVLQRPGFGEIIAAGSADPLATLLAEQADARGLALMLPQMDAQDQALISAADVRGRFDRVLEGASARYHQPLTLTAIIYAGNPVQVRWRLLTSTGERASGDFQADTEEAAVHGLLQAVVAIQVADYTVSAGTATDRLLQVRGIDGLPRWQSLMSYLRGLEGMEAVQLTRTSGDLTSVLLRFSGDTEQLSRLLAVNRHLQPCADANVAPATPQPVVADTDLLPPADGEVSAEPALPAYCWLP